MSTNVPGHPFIEPKNHASKGFGKSMELGGGGRFQALKTKLAAKGATNPGGLAAFIGNKKYGKAKMQSMAKAGKKS